MTQHTRQAPRPQVLITNPMRRKFNSGKTNNATAPASDCSLAGAVLHSVEVTGYEKALFLFPVDITICEFKIM